MEKCSFFPRVTDLFKQLKEGENVFLHSKLIGRRSRESAEGKFSARNEHQNERKSSEKQTGRREEKEIRGGN